MKIVVTTALMIATMLVAAAPLNGVLAQAPSGPPKPPAELKQLDIFVGTVNCAGKQNASPFGAAHANETVYVGKRDLGGSWVLVRVNEKKTKVNPLPQQALWQISYDPAAKQFYTIWSDRFGGWGPQTSPGWQGDSMTVTGDYYVAGQKLGARDVFSRKSPQEFFHTVELTGPDGKWFTFIEETCRKK